MGASRCAPTERPMGCVRTQRDASAFGANYGHITICRDAYRVRPYIGQRRTQDGGKYYNMSTEIERRKTGNVVTVGRDV